MASQVQGPYNLDLEPEKKHVFVTQLREPEDDKSEEDDPIKRIAVIKEKSGRLLETGVNTLQKTLLLKREVEISKVQYELDAKKSEFSQRMNSCKKKEEQLKRKQQVIRERIAKFDKFIKENEAKRKRAILKYQQELKTKELKSKELDYLQNELASLILRHHRLQNILQKYSKYEKYLTRVLDKLPEDYLEATDNMLTSLMMRFRTLSTTNKTLVDGLAIKTDEVETGQQQLQDMSQEHSKNLFVYNSELASSQQRLEKLRERNVKLDQSYGQEQQKFRQLNETLGQIKIAIENIADRCSRHPGEQEDMDYDGKLHLIQDFFLEREAVFQMVKRYDSLSGSQRERSSTERTADKSKANRQSKR